MIAFIVGNLCMYVAHLRSLFVPFSSCSSLFPPTLEPFPIWKALFPFLLWFSLFLSFSPSFPPLCHVSFPTWKDLPISYHLSFIRFFKFFKKYVWIMCKFIGALALGWLFTHTHMGKNDNQVVSSNCSFQIMSRCITGFRKEFTEVLLTFKHLWGKSPQQCQC